MSLPAVYSYLFSMQYPGENQTTNLSSVNVLCPALFSSCLFA